MTISNSDFDGNTDYSATCDGHHYWSFIFYGVTKFSMLNNYIHGTSGCSPKIGGDSAAKTSEQQQTAQSSDSVEQTEQQEYTPGTAMPSTEATQSSIQASDIENVWAETTDNFGVGKLD
ncbi:hypothetical protein PI124_g14217 [Phytophthora idaei]|nr:hypothetical protein PI124_g14217 [Phytophthora idaei]